MVGTWWGWCPGSTHPPYQRWLSCLPSGRYRRSGGSSCRSQGSRTCNGFCCSVGGLKGLGPLAARGWAGVNKVEITDLISIFKYPCGENDPQPGAKVPKPFLLRNTVTVRL